MTEAATYMTKGWLRRFWIGMCWGEIEKGFGEDVFVIGDAGFKWYRDGWEQAM